MYLYTAFVLFRLSSFLFALTGSLLEIPTERLRGERELLHLSFRLVGAATRFPDLILFAPRIITGNCRCKKKKKGSKVKRAKNVYLNFARKKKSVFGVIASSVFLLWHFSVFNFGRHCSTCWSPWKYGAREIAI